MQPIFTFSFLHILRCFSVIEIFATFILVSKSIHPSGWCFLHKMQCFYISAPLHITYKQWRSQHDNLVMLCKFFCVYRPCKESISKEINNDDLSLHSMTKLSGWLRHCIQRLQALRGSNKSTLHFIMLLLGISFFA